MTPALFRTAMTSPTRHGAFRRAVVGHIGVVAALLALVLRSDSLTTLGVVAQVLLVLGIVEGAAIVGWRLTQLPKSPALEFLLVTATPPPRVYFAELFVGLSRFAFVQFSALPVLVLGVLLGVMVWQDVVFLLLMPLIWGAIAGIGLCAWIYEPLRLRRIGEMLAFLGVMVYLVVGVLAAEKLPDWLRQMPQPYGQWIRYAIEYLNAMNPFGLTRYWFLSDTAQWVAWDRFINLSLFAFALMLLAAWRASHRLVGHFQDRHYQTFQSDRAAQTDRIGDRPLSWWAVRRVMEYSGRINLYLAGGFCLAYAAFIVLGDDWPSWMGRAAFLLFEMWGGPAMVVTAMAVMAAVPAVYQFGLWDQTVQDRCRRLELLLLTDLSANDYAHAAFRAAWSRGRGYFVVAGMLWISCAIAGRVLWIDALAAAAGSLVLWAFAFAIGFRGFATGHQTNGIASIFTLGCPLLLYWCWTMPNEMLAALVPTAVAFLPMKTGITIHWLIGFTLLSTVTFAIYSRALARCDRYLRSWFDGHQGATAAA